MTKGRIVREVVLWIIAVFLALICLRSGWLKVTGNIFWVRDFHRWGYPDWFRIVVGIAELTSMVLLLVPRFAGYGASLFAGDDPSHHLRRTHLRKDQFRVDRRVFRDRPGSFY